MQTRRGVRLRGTAAAGALAAPFVLLVLASSTLGGSGFQPSASAPRVLTPLAAQSGVLFQRTWGGISTDEAFAATTDSGGNIYVAGLTSSFGPCGLALNSLSILKYSPLGTLLMQKMWSNGSSIFGVSGIAVDAAGDIYVAGTTLWTHCASGNWYPFILKLDPQANLVWAKTVAQTDGQFLGLALDSAGNAFATGVLNAGPAGSQDVLVMKFSPSGAVLWGTSWGGPSYDNGNAIALDATGNVYVAGSTASYGPAGSNIVLLKLNPSGALVRQEVIGNGSETASSIAVDSAGNTYLLGSSMLQEAFALLVKVDPSGGVAWERTWGGPGGNTNAAAVAMDPSGGVAVTGTTNAFGSGGSCIQPTVCTDLFILRISAPGGFLSQLVYGAGGQNEQAWSLTPTFGRMVVVGGVFGASPFTSATGNQSLGAPVHQVVANANASLGSPTLPIQSIPGSSVATPAGNTTYAGGGDELLIEVGAPPTVGFAADLATGGTITFNGTSYVNGETASVPLGTVTATATANASYTFAGWTVSGGLMVASASSNTTSVTVVGSGVLTAHFVGSLSPGPPGIGVLPIVIGLVAGVIIVAAVFALIVLGRRRRRDGAPPSPPS